MASAYPVALFIVFAMFGSVVFPVAWWVMAYWQHKRDLRGLSKASLFWSATPILSWVILYLGAPEVLGPRVAVITFFLIPVANIVALAATTLVTVLQLRNRTNEAH